MCICAEIKNYTRVLEVWLLEEVGETSQEGPDKWGTGMPGRGNGVCKGTECEAGAEEQLFVAGELGTCRWWEKGLQS